jgi:outer membrane protein OmpA-like peptidoglycan-associated protein
MKMQKIKRTHLIAVLLLAGVSMQAQLRVKVTTEKLEQTGNAVNVSLLFDVSNVRMKPVESLIYTPILVSGSNRVELPKIIFKSNLRYKLDVREHELSGTPLEAVSNYEVNMSAPVFAVMKLDKKRNRQVPYKVSVPYRPWMGDATLQFREESFGCCGSPNQVTTDRGTQAKQVAINAQFRYLTPEKEKEKVRFEIGEAYLDFPQGQSIIQPDFRGNRRELEKINQMIVLVATDPDIKVTGAEMRGYASPEGAQHLNYELSYKRAQSMREYFAQMSRIPPGMFRTGIGGEDWESLKQMLLDKYYMLPQKWEILAIIERESDLDRREQLIKNVGGGAPYKRIYNELYPKLRRVDCQVNYVVRDFTLEEGKKRIAEKPKLLSQNEMYQIARTYPEGSREFNETLITARQYFPNNDIANLNGAAAALAEGDAGLAREYLEKIQNTGSAEYSNCLGVLYIYEGHYPEAEKYLKKAQAAGLEEATHNLRELARVIGEQPPSLNRR